MGEIPTSMGFSSELSGDPHHEPLVLVRFSSNQSRVEAQPGSFQIFEVKPEGKCAVKIMVYDGLSENEVSEFEIKNCEHGHRDS